MSTESEIRGLVRERYGAIARGGGSCCGSCEGGPELAPDGLDVIGDAYEGVDGHVRNADLSPGCGVPTRHAHLRPGETVLDLGSGAGNDAFIARHEVGPDGRVIGVDMTPEMITRARANAARLGYANVEFRQGEIEALPVEASSIDLVLSNCVLNLVPDKAKAFAEMFRVLKPGGRFCVSDIVSEGELAAEVRADAELLVGCIAGAIDRRTHLGLLESVGFTSLDMPARRTIDLPPGLAKRCGAGALQSVTVTGRKPG